MNDEDAFRKQVSENIKMIGQDVEFLSLSNIWNQSAIKHNYALNFKWLGRPIIQVPQDTYAIQELIWECRPDLIIETGIAHGGSLVMSASMLALLDYCDAVESGYMLDLKKSARKVVGVDIDIREHNRTAIEAHPMAHKIHMIEGSSISTDSINQVTDIADDYDRILIFLDSNHTHDHVLAELEAYAPLTSVGSYCVVWDTGVEDLPEDFCYDRSWGKGNNPKTAVWKYLETLKEQGRKPSNSDQIQFELDKGIEHKIAITAAPDGFLKRVK
jgi:cephalosporin hydroxylase